MSRILLGISILLLAATGFFSFQTKSKVVGLRETITTTEAKATTAEANHKKAEGELKTTQETLAAATAAKEAAEAATAAAKAEAEKTASELAAVQTQISAKDSEIETLKTQLAAVPSQDDASSEATTELTQKLQEAQAKYDEQVQLVRTLENKQRESDEQIAKLTAEKARHQAAVNAPGLEGKILAVDPNWNFVVLSIGDRQGVARSSTLLVKRGQSLIARLKVTTVNPSTSVADVIPGSLTTGNFIRPGDTVIYSGS